MKYEIKQIGSEVSLEDAEQLGAFNEDALTEADALASVEDAHEAPAEALPLQQ